MGRYEELAHTVIDLVESTIRRSYPFIDKLARQKKGNTLLYGEAYFDLENDVVEAVKLWRWGR